MSFRYQVRRRARFATLPLAFAFAMSYFGYHAVQGDRGLVAWLRLSNEIETVRTELAAVRTERERLQRRVALLRPEGLDPDLLDERARIMLGLGHPDDVVFKYR